MARAKKEPTVPPQLRGVVAFIREFPQGEEVLALDWTKAQLAVDALRDREPWGRETVASRGMLAHHGDILQLCEERGAGNYFLRVWASETATECHEIPFAIRAHWNQRSEPDENSDKTTNWATDPSVAQLCEIMRAQGERTDRLIQALAAQALKSPDKSELETALERATIARLQAQINDAENGRGGRQNLGELLDDFRETTRCVRELQDELLEDRLAEGGDKDPDMNNFERAIADKLTDVGLEFIKGFGNKGQPEVSDAVRQVMEG